MPFAPFFGFPIGIEEKFPGLSDSTKAVNLSDYNIFAGRALQIVTSGANAGLIGSVTVNAPCYGLSKINRNNYIDETAGAFGAYGSGQVTAILSAIVTVQSNAFTLDNETVQTVQSFDSSFVNAVPMSPVYTNLVPSGADFGMLTVNLISSGGSAAGQNDQTFIGYLTVPPASITSAAEILLVLGGQKQ
jgi:hypothetical protein